jgi:RNA polymerase sigma-70 factor, ECF subfamily
MTASDPELAARYNSVLRFLRRRVRNGDVAKDLTQQVFADAAASTARHGGSADPGLLFTIAKRRLIDERRKRQNDLPLGDGVHDGVATSGIAQAHLACVVSAALSRLDQHHREVVVLKLLRGLSFAEIAEIAEIVGASEAACKMRLQRGLEHLRDDLERSGIQP